MRKRRCNNTQFYCNVRTLHTRIPKLGLLFNATATLCNYFEQKLMLNGNSTRYPQLFEMNGSFWWDRTFLIKDKEADALDSWCSSFYALYILSEFLFIKQIFRIWVQGKEKTVTHVLRQQFYDFLISMLWIVLFSLPHRIVNNFEMNENMCNLIKNPSLKIR